MTPVNTGSLLVFIFVTVFQIGVSHGRVSIFMLEWPIKILNIGSVLVVTPVNIGSVLVVTPVNIGSVLVVTPMNIGSVC